MTRKKTEKTNNVQTIFLKKEIWRHRELYFFLLPGFIALIIFSYGPMYGIVNAFQDVKFGKGYGMNDWVGLYHFKRFFSSTWFGTIMVNTMSVSILQQILSWPVPIVIALLLHNCTKKGIKKTAQMTSYLPHLLSTVVVVSIINVFCAGDYGLINILLRSVGLERINFFGEPGWVYPMYIISSIWKDAGYSAVVYLGALSSVDEELMEASRIDGASKLQGIWYIQIPCIVPTVVTMFIMSMGNLFAMGADKMLLLQTDLNLSASEIISTYVYKTGVMQTQYGFSAAVGLFQNVINVTLLLIVNWICKKKLDTSII